MALRCRNPHCQLHTRGVPSSGRSRSHGPVWSGGEELPAAKGREGANGVPSVASPPVAVPRFIAARPAASAMLLAADGKLPELSLIEVQERGKSATAEAKKSRPKLLSAAIGLSMVMSVFLGMYDLSPVEPGADAKSVSRATIRKFYLRPDEEESLQPYQLLLRDAERAHSRGDDAIAAAKYRQVLRMLRIEGRPRGPSSQPQRHEAKRSGIGTCDFDRFTQRLMIVTGLVMLRAAEEMRHSRCLGQRRHSPRMSRSLLVHRLALPPATTFSSANVPRRMRPSRRGVNSLPRFRYNELLLKRSSREPPCGGWRSASVAKPGLPARIERMETPNVAIRSSARLAAATSPRFTVRCADVELDGGRDHQADPFAVHAGYPRQFDRYWHERRSWRICTPVHHQRSTISSG